MRGRQELDRPDVYKALQGKSTYQTPRSSAQIEGGRTKRNQMSLFIFCVTGPFVAATLYFFVLFETHQTKKSSTKQQNISEICIKSCMEVINGVLGKARHLWGYCD